MTRSLAKDIVVRRSEVNFDKACEEAYEIALIKFGIDENGHARDKNFPRSESSLHVQSVVFEHIGGMGGQSYMYRFIAWMEREDTDE